MKDFRFKTEVKDREITCHYITSNKYALHCRRKLLERSKKTLGFDIETGKLAAHVDDKQAGLCPYRSFISLVQFFDGIDTVYMFDALSVNKEIWAEIIEKKQLIAHNALFDYSHLRLAGVEPMHIRCSMVMYNLITPVERSRFEKDSVDEGTPGSFLSATQRRGASLQVCTAKLLDVYVEKELQISDWTNRPLDKKQLLYAAKDSYFTYEIGKIINKKINEYGLDEVAELNRQALDPTVQMILNGFRIDKKKHIKHCKEMVKKKDVLHTKMLRVFGENINVNSSQQLSNWFKANLPDKYLRHWPRTEKTEDLPFAEQRLQTGSKILDQYANLKFVDPLLQYRVYEKLTSTYGIPLLDKINPVTGNLHCSYTLGFTWTGRMSSRNPNLQNIPSRTPDGKLIREVFTASKDHILVGADYNQMELRLLALYSQDRTMLKSYENGADVHMEAATVALNRPASRISQDERALQKNVNFALAYGRGVRGIIMDVWWNSRFSKKRVKLSEGDAYRFINGFYKKFPDVKKWQERMRSKAEKDRYSTTKLNKIRKLSKDELYTIPVNHPIQGTAAEVMLKANVNLVDNGLTWNNSYGIKMLVCVHDEQDLDVPDDEKSKKIANDLLQTSMRDAMIEFFPKASLKNLVDVKTGYNWSQLK